MEQKFETTISIGCMFYLFALFSLARLHLHKCLDANNTMEMFQLKEPFFKIVLLSVLKGHDSRCQMRYLSPTQLLFSDASYTFSLKKTLLYYSK